MPSCWESVKAGKAPLAIINRRVDPILALGAILADELYHQPVPYIVVSDEELGAIAEGDQVTIVADGTVSVSKR